MVTTTQLLWCILVVSLALASCFSSMQRHGPPEKSLPDEIDEMGPRHGKAHEIRPDTEATRQFATAYFSAGAQKRPVFAQYLTTLGPEAILDFLEATYPACHGQAHELGQVMFAQVQDITSAIGMCQTRCTSGCMHGVLKEAFGGSRIEDLTPQVHRVCHEGAMAQIHPPGNCAHGIGHALMVAVEPDLEKAIASCVVFENAAMEYYCATGVFMEFFAWDKTRPSEERQPRGLHFPCDISPRFPAACYRYKVRHLLRAFGEERARVVQECLQLPRARQLGCFHGLGAAYTGEIGRHPALLPAVCLHGTPEDQIMCIEGAIEKLAEYHEAQAHASCATLTKEMADICTTAAREKMYRLHKPTIELYLIHETLPSGGPSHVAE
jgi:hypothetical protein